MSTRVRCHCRSCTIHSLVGPSVVITVGVLFLLHEMNGGHFSFMHTWPVLLVVIGLVHLASAFAPRDGHIDTCSVPLAAAPGAPPPVPPTSTGGTPDTFSSSREQ
jgi:Domain of unknown function (DUF5668)